MVLSYKEIIDLLGNDYQIKKAIQRGDLIKIDDGLYTPGDYTPLEVLVKKYPQSVFTFTTGLYLQDLIIEIPSTYYVASKKDSTRIKDEHVHQSFVNPKRLFEYVDLVMKDGIQLMVYSKEKLLISLIKNRNKINPGLYHEAILSFRRIVGQLNKKLIFSLINKERYKEKYTDILIKEVL